MRCLSNSFVTVNKSTVERACGDLLADLVTERQQWWEASVEYAMKPQPVWSWWGFSFRRYRKYATRSREEAEAHLRDNKNQMLRPWQYYNREGEKRANDLLMICAHTEGDTIWLSADDVKLLQPHLPKYHGEPTERPQEPANAG